MNPFFKALQRMHKDHINAVLGESTGMNVLVYWILSSVKSLFLYDDYQKEKPADSTILIVFFSLGASDMLILCLELIRGRLAVMSAEIRKLFFIILTTLIEKSPVSITQLHYLFWGQDQNHFLFNKALEDKRNDKIRKKCFWWLSERGDLELDILPEWVTNERQINSKHEKTTLYLSNSHPCSGLVTLLIAINWDAKMTFF